MKVSKDLLKIIAVAVTVNTLTACVKDEITVVPKKADDPSVVIPHACLACGKG
jgi:hypothetical protein